MPERNALPGKITDQPSMEEQGRLLSAHARESKKTFLLCHFCECIAGRAVVGPAEFNNRIFEGESFFN